MDLNDPRRRLQVAKASNPSLRLAASPQQKPITLAYQRPQGIALNYTTPVNRVATFTQPTAQPSQSAPKPQQDQSLQVRNDQPQVSVQPQKPSLWSGVARFFNKPISEGGGNFVGDLANIFVKAPYESAKTVYDQGKVRVAAGPNGGSPISGQGAEQLKQQYANDLKAGKISQDQYDEVARKIDATSSRTTNAIKSGEKQTGISFKSNQDPVLGGAIADTLLNVSGTEAFAKPIINMATSGGKNVVSTVGRLFKPKSAENIVESIVKEKSPDVIQAALKVDPQTAGYLANESNPDVVREVVKSLHIDPNIKLSDATKTRLQDEGVSAVNQKDTPYGAEYNPNDASINVKDQSFATDANLDHELGHHIWKTKLTPEEKSLFANVNGPARAQAAGRAGYTADDAIAEDFSSMIQKALTGHMDEVPTDLQGVISKYAKVAQKEAAKPGNLLPATTKTLGDLPRNVGDNFVMADKPAPKLPEIQKRLKQIDKKFNDVQQGKSTMTRDEINALAKEQEDLISQAQKPFESAYNAMDGKPADAQAITQQAEAVGKAQTGTADGAITPSGEPLAPADSTLTAKTTQLSDGSVRTEAQLKQELSDITSVPRGKRTVAQQERAQEIRKAIKELDTNSVDMAQPTVDDLFPNMSPEAKALVQETMDKLDEANAGWRDAAKARKVQTAQRSQAGNSAFEAAGGGQAGFKAEMAAQRGKKAASSYDPIVGHQAAKDEVINDLYSNTNLMDWERRNTYNAFQKMWGDIEGKPTPGDVKKIRDYYNSKQDGLGDAVAQMLDENRGTQEEFNWFEQVVGAPRTLMTVGDASAPRQLAVSFTRHPVTTTKNYVKSFVDMFSGKKFAANTEKMASLTDETGKNYADFMESEMNLHLPNVAEQAAEESMSSATLFSKASKLGKDSNVVARTAALPVRFVGHVVDASNRGMSAAVAGTRFDITKRLIDNAGGVEEFGKNLSSKELQDLGEVINTITGRGGKKGGFTDKSAHILSKALFSSKLLASRLNMLNPYWYYRLSGPARTEALTSAASFAATTGALLTLIKAAGFEVGLDPTSADFGKVKIGNTRYDITGGYAQYPRVVAQMLLGHKTSSVTGEKKDTTIADIAGGVAEGKLNPLLGYAWTIARSSPSDSGNPLIRKDEYGDEFNIADKGSSLLMPLNLSGIGDTTNDTGNPALAAAMNAPSIFGVGVQTYGNKPTKNQNGYTGKVTEDMVLGNDGKPLLDKNGNPVKVTFDKNATSLEKQALLDEKQRSESRKLFVSKQSKEDQALMKLSATELADYVDEGKLDQAKADHILRLKKGAEDYNQPIKTPKGANSDYAKGFYQKFNSMTAKDQKAWLDQKPDSNSTALTQKLNAERPKGLDEFKPSNKLAKLYAEYEKAINTKEIDDFTREEKTRAFQKDAYKLNFGKRPGQIYDEGGSNDLKQKIDNGEISKADLDAALKMDADMYAAGVTSSLKFSKKFRNTYGYSTPAGAGGSGSGGRSGGKSAQLASLMPSFANSPAAPKISSKRRTTGISFKNINAPTKSTSKKVSINL